MKRLLFVLILLALLPVASTASEANGGEYNVVVSSRSLPMGHIITRSDVRIAYKNKADKRAVTELADVVGSQVRRPISKGSTVKRDYLKNPSIVKKGDKVILIASRGGLKVTVKGIARGGGEIGEVVKVENLRSGEYVEAEIIGPSMARVQF